MCVFAHLKLGCFLINQVIENSKNYVVDMDLLLSMFCTYIFILYEFAFGFCNKVPQTEWLK